MKKLVLFFCVFISELNAQDTFSILAFDSITGEVGAAGASCVDLFQFPGYSNHFIAELFPGDGAIATQASYLAANQNNARNRMSLGDSPQQLIDWLKINDAGGVPSVRQYGVVRIANGYPRAAAHTGTNCMNFKNHRIGPNYTIQGNILLGAQVLDSMEVRFKREKGDLACKLMAAMQGANMVGADSRCSGNGTSSLFAFIQVAQPTDQFDQPSFLQSLKTSNGAGIEPIDSLQKLFDASRTCFVDLTKIEKLYSSADFVDVYPTPASEELNIELKKEQRVIGLKIRNALGQIMLETEFFKRITTDVKIWPKGIYFIELRTNQRVVVKRLNII